ncbi:carbohydrate-binding X8 domain-containing protein-like [Hibiscus syriacus]|uniref:carbohydrate-binding X8 domain-containing protein-like n=1 Tax=Hibiscus syriacus TaxID=106335 RepID=UPI0019215D78|nr:carbohydrate-binding X8 domain-containing protein-like [Hibiscus syriacus]
MLKLCTQLGTRKETNCKDAGNGDMQLHAGSMRECLVVTSVCYFQRYGQAQGSCDFSGTVAVSPNPPPNVASTCSFPSSSTGANTGTTPTETTTTGSTTNGSTTGIPTTVFGGTRITLGPTGTTSINDPSSAMGLFTNNLFCTFVATTTLWILGSSWL